jgi:hypothetical protein
MVHTDRMRPFKYPETITLAETTAFAAVDEYVEKFVDVENNGKNKKKWRFKIHLLGYEPDDDSWLGWDAVKNLQALDDIVEQSDDPELKEAVGKG